MSRDERMMLDAFFGWVRGVVQPGEIIAVGLGGKTRYYTFRFPLAPHHRPSRVVSPVQKNIVFHVSNTDARSNSEGEWVTIFHTKHFSVSERRTRKLLRRPVRWGLSPTEKTCALDSARGALAEHLGISTKETRRTISSIFDITAAVDVALWVDGELRGSRIAEYKSLYEGVREATQYAARDQRFLPITPEEYERVTIEIIIFSDLALPVRYGGADNTFDTTVGYRLDAHNRRGYFVPNVFNVVRFGSWGDMRSRLAEKAGVSADERSSGVVSAFRVDHFAECAEGILSYSGPTPDSQRIAYTSERLRSRLQLAAQWLEAIQNTDGSIPAVVDPTGEDQTTDWVRTAFTAYALAEYADAADDEQSRKVAAAAGEYVSNTYLAGEDVLSPEHHILVLVFCARLMHALGSREECTRLAEKVCVLVKKEFSFEPILYAHVVTFIDDMITAQVLSQDTASLTEPYVAGLLERMDTADDYVAWAEAVRVFETRDTTRAAKIRNWIVAAENTDGSFPQKERTDFRYARGASKILEILALDKDIDEQVLMNSFRWLFSQQYMPETAYIFVPEVRSRVIGGFRHDALDTSLWIDAAGHFLLAGVRMLRRQS